MSARLDTEPVALARRYFDGWRRRDASAVIASLAPGGTYEDPTTGGAVAGDALVAYLRGLWTAFPDLDFELGDVDRVGMDRVHAAWRMRGVNRGSFAGLPPTGCAVDLQGFDVLVVDPAGIRSVRGYFDSAAVPRQLGLQVVVQPGQVGPFEFGVSTVVRRDRAVWPGVLAFTELIAASDAHAATIREVGRQTVAEHLGDPAFLGFTASTAGRRMTTVSAWSSHEAMSAAMRTGTHARAMQQFFRDGIAEGGHTAVYAPVRTGPHWRRCGACGAMARLDGPRGACGACGAAVAALP